MSHYQKADFDKWYRDPRYRVSAQAKIARKARLAVAVAAYYLGRPPRNALDIGCGEGQWQPVLASLGLSYLGIEPSRYAVEKFGQRRNIVAGSFGDLPPLGPAYDLIICSDSLYFVPDDELLAGLEQLVPRLRGVAFLEAYASDAPLDGDTSRMIPRTAAFYRKVFRHAGLRSVGSHCYVGPALYDQVTELERGQGA